MNKPWDNEPTPMTDAECRDGEYPLDMGGKATLGSLDYTRSPKYGEVVPAEKSRNLERRMRAAERLLDDERQWSESSYDFANWSHDVHAHLEAARKEDGE